MNGQPGDFPDSVKLQSDGPAGSLRAAGYVRTNDNKFTSGILFYDPKTIRQPHLFATNLRLARTEPRMVLRNISETALTARPRFLPAGGGSASPFELAPIVIAPRQAIEVDLRQLVSLAATRSEFRTVSVQIVNSGATGSLIGALCAADEAKRITHTVPLRDSGPKRNSTGGYPWKIEGDYSTLVSITNIGDKPAKFIANISFNGGRRLLPATELAIGESAFFDVKKLRDEQTPDKDGKFIPRSVQGGQFHWSVIEGGGTSRLIGRMEVVSLSRAVSSSFSCPVCCPDSGPYGGFNPNARTLAVDGFAFTAANGDYYNCYGGFSYNTPLILGNLFVGDPACIALAHQGGGDYRIDGLGAGQSVFGGYYTLEEWDDDGADCYYFASQPEAGGDATVASLTFSSSTLASYLPTNGNSVNFTATLSPSTAAGVIRFEIYDISALAGIAMNSGTQTTPDYDFSQNQSGFSAPVTTGSGVSLVYKLSTSSSVNSATASVFSRDYGGYCKIRVFAIVDGVEISGAFSGTSSNLARVPRDDDNDKMPDAGWTVGSTQINEQNTAPASDADNNPSGNGMHGDGLTDFEEYRGFIVRGSHRRTNPFQKDLFILSELPQGIGDSDNLPVTKHALNSGELDNSRIVNFNYTNSGFGGSIQSHFNQQGLRVVDGGFGANNIFGEVTAVGPPNSQTGNVRIFTLFIRHASPPNNNQTNVDPFDGDKTRQTSGHEIGHGANISHYVWTGTRLTVMVSLYFSVTSNINDPAWNNIPHTYDAQDTQQIQVR